ncbi:MAG: Hsp20/alpha crystallin family protein [Acidobacteria bacterium]|nr:Hsp20/alpha crystallin family protein [Acidobacteriota bacterium]
MPIVAFSRWDPLHDLIALHERLNRLGVDDTPGWTPAVDLYETPDRFVLSLELPGLSREHVKIEVQQDALIVRGERPVHREDAAHYHRVERGHGAFARSFALPHPVDVESVAAEFRDGVLTVVVPKAVPQQRRVDIQ